MTGWREGERERGKEEGKEGRRRGSGIEAEDERWGEGERGRLCVLAKNCQCVLARTLNLASFHLIVTRHTP